MMVSIFSACSTKLMRSIDWMSPLTNWVGGTGGPGQETATAAWQSASKAFGRQLASTVGCRGQGGNPQPGYMWAARRRDMSARVHLEVGQVRDGLQVVQAGAVVQLVQHHDLHGEDAAGGSLSCVSPLSMMRSAGANRTTRPPLARMVVVAARLALYWG